MLTMVHIPSIASSLLCHENWRYESGLGLEWDVVSGP
jgi:hypothetical protein